MKTARKEPRCFAYIEDVIASANQQFPKRCKCCDLEFKSFVEFIEKTYIPPHNDSRNIQIIQCDEGHTEDGHILAYRNCTCHSTITILCVLEDELKAKMFGAIEEDAKAMGGSMESVMEVMRDRIVAISSRAA